MTRADETVAAQVEALSRELAGSIIPEERTNRELRLDLEEENANYRNKPKDNVKRRGSRGFAKFLFAICIGVAGTSAWQSYGEAVKQLIAARAPELGWSPQAKQMIASWTAGWEASSEKIAPESIAPKASPVPVDPAQVQQIAQSLAALREAMGQVAANQDQMSRDIASLESAVAKLIAKTPESSAQPPVALERKPVPTPPSSRAPTGSRH